MWLERDRVWVPGEAAGTSKPLTFLCAPSLLSPPGVTLLGDNQGPSPPGRPGSALNPPARLLYSVLGNGKTSIGRWGWQDLMDWLLPCQMLVASILVTLGCCSEVPQTRGLKTLETSPHRSGGCKFELKAPAAATLPLKALGKVLPSFFQLLVAVGGPCFVDTSLPPSSGLFPVCLRAHPSPVSPHLNLLIRSSKTL